MNPTESLRQAAQLPLWLDTLKEQLRSELITQNNELAQVRQELQRQNQHIEKLIEIMLTTAEMLRQRLNHPPSSKS